MATSVGSSALPKSPFDQLFKSRELKDEGAGLFKIGEWRKAAKKYHHSLLYAKAVLTSAETNSNITGMLGLAMNSDNESVEQATVTREQQDEAKQLTIALSNNLAICMLKLDQWDNVVKHSSNVIEYDPDNVKALYRRGTALMKLGRLDDSRNDLQQALKLDPSDQGVKKQNVVLQEVLKDYWKGEKQKYQGMFSPTSVT